MTLFKTYIVVAVIGCIMQLVFIIIDVKGYKKTAITLKILAACCFVVCGFLGLQNIIGQNSMNIALTNSSTDLTLSNFKDTFGSPHNLVVIGLLTCIGLGLGAMGDAFLAVRHTLKKGSKPYDIVFLTGIGFFFTGHIFYAIVAAWGSQIWYVWLIVAVVIAMIFLYFFYKILHAKPIYKLVGRLYCSILFATVMMAFGKIFEYACAGGLLSISPGLSFVVFAVGILVFAVSDVLMAFNSFGLKKSRKIRICNLSLYYIGQMLIAVSLLYL